MGVNSAERVPIDPEVESYTTLNYSRAYIHHLLKAKEFLAGTLCTIHNVYFMVKLVENIRASIIDGTRLRVETTIDYQPVFLDLIGVGTMTSTGAAEVRLVEVLNGEVNP